MENKIVTLKEAKDFVSENGYMYAVYDKKEDGNYHLLESALWETPIDDETNIVVKTYGCGVSFNEFETVDKKYCFRLHNNFNIPEIIPVFKSR